jgi:hypothetical protein
MRRETAPLLVSVLSVRASLTASVPLLVRVVRVVGQFTLIVPLLVIVTLLRGASMLTTPLGLLVMLQNSRDAVVDPPKLRVPLLVRGTVTRARIPLSAGDTLNVPLLLKVLVDSRVAEAPGWNSACMPDEINPLKKPLPRRCTVPNTPAPGFAGNGAELENDSVERNAVDHQRSGVLVYKGG